MAEGIVGGILTEDEQKSETEAVAGAEAFAAAVAAIASRQDPEVARRTAEFLGDQSRLLRTQAQHLEDEHALRLAQLRAQRLAQTLRIGFQVAIALLIIVIGAGIVVMLHDAFTSHRVVIDAFDSPAALTARGVTGTVLASDILDELTRLQSATVTPEQGVKRNLSNGWSNEVKVAVPETGISLGEISQLLTDRFGHDTHIGGDLVQTDSGGLALSVRGDHVTPKTFAGNAGQLDSLVTNAAQYLYSQFQPELWATYLVSVGHCPEAVAFIDSVYDSVDASSRASLLVAHAACGGTRRGGRLLQAAIKLYPDDWEAYLYLQTGLIRSGDEEGAWHVGQALRKAAGGEPGAVGQAGATVFGLSDLLAEDLQAELNELVSDMQANAGSGVAANGDVWDIARNQALLHDPTAAEVTLETVRFDPHNAEDVANLHLVRGLLAADTGDTATAATEFDAAEAELSGSGLPLLGNFASGVACQLAVSEDAAGHPNKADAVIASGSHYVDCQRFRGDILDHRGDCAGAQQAYAQAVALAPDLPAGYYSWGAALARHGDLAGAIAKLQAANQRGPHWADPLKAWGDLLAKQGHWKDALAKYDEALKYAPNWAALKQARAAVVGRST